MGKKGQKLFKRSDGFREKDLLQSAMDHLACSKLLFERHPRCYDSAGYLASLGIELLLKALLLHFRDSFPAEHDLERLYISLKSLNSAMALQEEQIKALRLVNEFSALRYPSTEKPIEIGDEDWSQIELLWDYYMAKLPGEMRTEFKSIDPTIKGGRRLAYKMEEEG